MLTISLHPAPFSLTLLLLVSTLYIVFKVNAFNNVITDYCPVEMF